MAFHGFRVLSYICIFGFCEREKERKSVYDFGMIRYDVDGIMEWYGTVSSVEHGIVML